MSAVAISQSQWDAGTAVLRNGCTEEAYARMLRSYSPERARALEWQRYQAAFADAIRHDPDARRDWLAENARFKEIAPASAFASPALTQIALAYANEDYVGETLCPVFSSGVKQVGQYPQWGIRDRLQVPDAALSHRGHPTEISENITWGTYTCQGYGLSYVVSRMAIDQQDEPLDLLASATAATAEVMALAREVRISTLLSTGGNYAGNTAAIAAANRWSTAGGGDPIADIQGAQALLWNGRGPGSWVAFTNLAVYQQLSRHPAILALFQYNGSSPGLATPDMIAAFFGFSRLVVGRARRDTANEGQAATYAAVWGNNFGIVRVPSSTASMMENAWTAATFRLGAPEVVSTFEPLQGHRGSYVVANTVYEVSQMYAPLTGYLLTTVI